MYKKKNKKKQRSGRVERLKETIHKKDGEVEQIRMNQQAVKKLATKAITSNKRLRRYVFHNSFITSLVIAILPCVFIKLLRKLDETELENIILRDPRRSNRLNRLHCSVAVSNNGPCTGTSLLSCIKILNEDDLNSTTAENLGSGQYGTCFLRTLGHYSVCVKVFKRANKTAFIDEANILLKFTHHCLPYLFGICVGDCTCIVTSVHGISDTSPCFVYKISGIETITC